MVKVSLEDFERRIAVALNDVGLFVESIQFETNSGISPNCERNRVLIIGLKMEDVD